MCIFYRITYIYYTEEYIQNRAFQLFILTIIIPLLIFRVLKKLNYASNLMLEKIKERRLPYLIAVLLNLYITKFVFAESYDVGLYYFFAGISFTSISFLILSYLNFKASLHAAAISGLTMFYIGLSIHFQINLIFGIGLLILINGLIASSRLHLKAHTPIELIIGFLLGFLPQIMMTIYWI